MTLRKEPLLLGLLLFLLTSAGGCASRKRPQGAAEIVPREGAVERGLASWYGKEFAGLPTASGEIFDPEKVTAAHRTLPFGTVVEVTNERNGRSITVPINDRGPFISGRIIDLSRAAAAAAGSVLDGVVPVTLRVLSVGAGDRKAPKGKTVKLPATWLVQAGAFADRENASRLRDRLSQRYPNPFTEDFQGLLRVKFGPYPSRPAAEAARDSLSELGLAGIIVPVP